MHCVEGVPADAEGVRFEWVLGMRTGFSCDVARYELSVGGEKKIGLNTGRNGARKCPRRHNLMITQTGQWYFNEDAITQI